MRPRTILLACIALVAALAPLYLHGYALYLATEVALYAIAATALDLLVGYAGLVSLGQAAYFGIGAYAAAIVAAHFGADLWLTLAAGFVCAAIFAAVTAPLTLRSHGIFFLMVTLAFSQLAYATADKWHSLTGGSDGLVVPKLTLSDPAFYLITLGILAAVLLALGLLVRSPFGRVLAATRQNETRVRALGLSAFWYKYWAIVLVGGITGLAGVLHAHHRAFVSLADLHWTNSVTLLVMVLLGGRQTLWGGVVGAAVFTLLEAWISSKTDQWEMFVIGAVLIAIVLFTPRGFVSLWYVVFRASASSSERA
jgi:branched-chain amino acid transport system permease protein